MLLSCSSIFVSFSEVDRDPRRVKENFFLYYNLNERKEHTFLKYDKDIFLAFIHSSLAPFENKQD